MIVVDIETSGLDFNKSGVWQIGAVDLDNPDNIFLEEARIDDEDEVNEKSLEVTGKTEGQLRDKNKQSQKMLIENFFKWCDSVKIKNCICQNPQWDMGFLMTKAKKYGSNRPFHHRAFDLHSIAQLRYFLFNKKFLIKEEISNSDFSKVYGSDMGLSKVLIFVGMRDDRGKHNALEDAKLTAECFSRIVYGRGLFKEYANFQIPDYLKEEKNDNL
ncbi:hypothetical protein GF386_06140 [Candidatus Pacearchaeota archaeon]|nr:hypothetical protein [Candidatus Pacearchaeota archaeon]MBD3283669.1 hypothetical protein [Candidatus Pacearchaeota archaeon]